MVAIISTPASKVTILGFGSLLSERSARLTFPSLQSFRLGRVPGYRRVFAHPAAIFFEKKIANLETLEISSLSAEPCSAGTSSFVCSVFEVDNDGFLDADGNICEAFREREEEFDIKNVPYTDVNGGSAGEGILCCRSTDDEYVRLWGKERFEKKYKMIGIDTIWGWRPDSGLRPCAAYLRHCIMAAKKMGDECHESFLDETFLVDRVTTVRAYLKEEYENVMNAQVPPELADRYSG